MTDRALPDTGLILALDVPDRPAAEALLRPLKGRLQWVKIGLQLFLREGPTILDVVADDGFNVFLDLKLHDIPNTVASAIKALAGHRVGLLTLHASGGEEMLRRASEAAKEALPEARTLGVTVLTSMDAAGLSKIGVEAEPEAQVQRLAKLATHAGVDGLVCSPLELTGLRRELGPAPLLVTPGIRPADADKGDQKRVMTPTEARAGGASFIVVGRPILQAPDPLAAVASLLDELSTKPASADA